MVDVRYPIHPSTFGDLDVATVRERFVVDDLFVSGQARLAISLQDRVAIGGVVTDGTRVTLIAPPDFRTDGFCDHREVGIACLERGQVDIGSDQYELDSEDILYAGRGSGEISFSGDGAVFYLVSTIAHHKYPTTQVSPDRAETFVLGDQAHSNQRTLRKYIHEDGVKSCQLTMGITTLREGSVWNTMPCHIHDRRSEIYLYIGLPESERIVHMCGPPGLTRSLVVGNRQAVISPPWSIHCGAGTTAYSFVWATGGENQSFADMDQVATHELR